MSQKVFITGATGYIGSALSERLARVGFEVYGLTRTAERARGLSARGVVPVFGDLKRPETYLAILKNCDAAVHAAFDNENGPAALDHKALEAFRAAAQDGRLRRLLYTSGVWVHGDTAGEVVDENTPLNPLELVTWRAAHEEAIIDLLSYEVEAVIFRPGIVYGESRGIIGAMFDEARDRGTVSYPGDGSQHWVLVHRDDVAEAYALGLEHAQGDERYLLGDGSSHTAREVAEAIAAATGAKARSWDADEVVKKLGAYGRALLASQKVSSAKARRELGWVPRHTSFVNEVQSLYQEWRGPAEASVT